MELSEAVKEIKNFCGADLTRTLAKIEGSLQGATSETSTLAVSGSGNQVNVLTAAGLVKRLAGQISVVIHALGILHCLPHLLESGEVIEYVSLGAGNTGRAFDLETNKRIAEFKFISWQGGPEAIRQNALFKDFYLMAEHAGTKRKYLYVMGTEHPLKFFNSGRSLSSVLSRHVKLKSEFFTTFGDQYRTVRDYYVPRQHAVTVQDVSGWLPELLVVGIEPDEQTM
jgi:hypothetical protein